MVERWWRFQGSGGTCENEGLGMPSHTDLVVFSEFFPFRATPPCLAISGIPSHSHVSVCTLQPRGHFPVMLSSWAHDLSPSYGSPFGLACPTPSLIFTRMARDRPIRSLRQQVRQPRCPSCGKRFADILRHLNHRHSKCADWFNAANPHHNHQLPSSQHEYPLNGLHHYEHPIDSLTDLPTPEGVPSAPQSPSSSHQRVQFPNAARTFGRAKTFMEKFHDDRYSEFRTSNIYYPFSGKAEWDLASFLLSSGLSMRKTNEFLQLKMVSRSSYFIREVC
jgi:hypothetical protein